MSVLGLFLKDQSFFTKLGNSFGLYSRVALHLNGIFILKIYRFFSTPRRCIHRADLISNYLGCFAALRFLFTAVKTSLREVRDAFDDTPEPSLAANLLRVTIPAIFGVSIIRSDGLLVLRRRRDRRDRETFDPFAIFARFQV